MAKAIITRPSWSDYFFNIAKAISSRATCPRAQVGAVIVRNNRILSTGYNGSAPGRAHCFEVGCLMADGHCQTTLHAEVNAIAFAARSGVSIEGSKIYLYINVPAGSISKAHDGSCRECQKMEQAAGVSSVHARSERNGIIYNE